MIKKLKEENVSLLDRKRIVYELDYSRAATPKRDEVVKLISKDLDVGEDLIKLKHVYPGFGVGKASVVVDVYKTKESLKKFEMMKKKAKKREKEEEETQAALGEKKEDGKEESKEQKTK